MITAIRLKDYRLPQPEVIEALIAPRVDAEFVLSDEPFLSNGSDFRANGAVIFFSQLGRVEVAQKIADYLNENIHGGWSMLYEQVVLVFFESFEDATLCFLKYASR